jgi:hypothetical protein
MARRLLPIAWLLALLLVPAVAWLLGGRQGLLDNRRKTAVPAFNVKTLRHAAFYKQLDAALFERLPPRARALDLHGRISVSVFGDSSSPDLVALGDHGYRYYVPGTRTCGAAPPTADPADAAEILARTLVAAGKRALVLEPADKLFVHPQDVPHDFPGDLACARRLQEQVDERLLSTPGGGLIDEALRTLEAGGTSTFLKTDTHWNGDGRLLYVQRVLEALRPGLAAQTHARLGDPYNKHGDMNAMLGITTTERDRLVTADPADPAFAPGSAVVVGDSQTERAFLDPEPGGAPSLAQRALPGVTFCSLPQTLAAGCDAALLSARSVVVESVGRNLSDFERMCQRPVGILAQPLTGPAGTYANGDGSARPDPRQVTIGAGGFEEVRIVARGGAAADDARVPRLIKIPVVSIAAGQKVTLSQDAHNGLPTPCATPDEGAAGSALVLPVPAGRKLSDVPVVLRAPAGTVLGAPRAIALDGSPAPRAATGAHR